MLVYIDLHRDNYTMQHFFVPNNVLAFLYGFGGADHESGLRFSLITNLKKIWAFSEIPDFLGVLHSKKIDKKYNFQLFDNLKVPLSRKHHWADLCQIWRI